LKHGTLNIDTFSISVQVLMHTTLFYSGVGMVVPILGNNVITASLTATNT